MMEESAKECVLNYKMYDNFKTRKPCACVCVFGVCIPISKSTNDESTSKNTGLICGPVRRKGSLKIYLEAEHSTQKAKKRHSRLISSFSQYLRNDTAD